MNKGKWLLLALLLSTCLITHGQAIQMNAPQSSASDISTVAFCDLVSEAAAYDGKEVRVRALYHSGFEWSAFSDPSDKSCDEKSMVWVEFDKSVESRTKPEISKKLEESFYRIVIAKDGNGEGHWLDWQTEVLVTGRIYKPNETGYGHTNIYTHKFVVTSVEEVGSVKKVDTLAKEQ